MDFYWVLCFLFLFYFFVGSVCLVLAVGGAGDAVFVLLGVVVVIVAVFPALPVVEEGRQDLWEVGADTSVVLWDVGGLGFLVPGDAPMATRCTSLGCGWEGKCGCGAVGSVTGSDAYGLALISDLHHRVGGGVVLFGRVEGEWGLLASHGTVHQELPKALLADDLEVRGGGRAESGKHVWACVGWACVVCSELWLSCRVSFTLDHRE
jgi:hypothetical protein